MDIIIAILWIMLGGIVGFLIARYLRKIDSILVSMKEVCVYLEKLISELKAKI